MNDYVLDTQILYWYLTRDVARLTPKAKAVLDQIEEGKARGVITTISLVGLLYKSEHPNPDRRIERRVYDDLIRAIVDDQLPNLELIDLEFEVVQAVERIDRGIVPDLPDRIIAATALAFRIPIVTSDSEIQRLPNVLSIW